MNDMTNDHVGPMRSPPHLGELIRENMDELGWTVTRTAEQLGLRAGHAVTPAERQGGAVGHQGAGAGGRRLGHRRPLDADAGELRTRAGAPGPDFHRGHGLTEPRPPDLPMARRTLSGWLRIERHFRAQLQAQSVEDPENGVERGIALPESAL